MHIQQNSTIYVFLWAYFFRIFKKQVKNDVLILITKLDTSFNSAVKPLSKKFIHIRKEDII